MLPSSRSTPSGREISVRRPTRKCTSVGVSMRSPPASTSRNVAYKSRPLRTVGALDVSDKPAACLERPEHRRLPGSSGLYPCGEPELSNFVPTFTNGPYEIDGVILAWTLRQARAATALYAS